MIANIISVVLCVLGVLVGTAQFAMRMEARRRSKVVSGVPLVAGGLVAVGVLCAGADWPFVAIGAVVVELPAFIAGRLGPRTD